MCMIPVTMFRYDQKQWLTWWLNRSIGELAFHCLHREADCNHKTAYSHFTACTGKSTTINVLTGVLPPTGGDAIINGETLTSAGGMETIRSRMGVCPQFDLLWNELTALEHMKLFGHIKGLPDAESVNAEALQLLDEVRSVVIFCWCIGKVTPKII